jgi:hypothetical protein
MENDTPNQPVPASELSITDRLEFALMVEQFRSAQLTLQNAQLTMQLAEMRLDAAKNRIKVTYNLQNQDQIDPVSGRITRV